MDKKAHLDFETRSQCDLKKCGVAKYADDASTRAWGFSYQFEEGGVSGNIRRWKVGDPDPVELLEHIASGGIVVAHNAAFERLIWNIVMRRMGYTHWPLIRIEQQDCTMARAAAIARPQSLEKLANAMHLQQLKDSEGAKLMMKMAVPKRVYPDGRVEWIDDAASIDRLFDYCDQDIRAEADVDIHIPPLTPREKLVWQFDQRMNERGIPVDVFMVQRCSELVTYAKKQADSEMRYLTNRMVPKCSSGNKIVEFIASRGVPCTTVKKGVQDDLLFLADLHNDNLVKEVIQLRRSSNKTSTAKYEAMLKCVSGDNRVRFLLNYHGATTGRWAGRLVQPQNFPRIDANLMAIKWLIELIYDPSLSVSDIYDIVSSVHGPSSVLFLLSKALRATFKAPEGRKFVGGDFSNIEGRVNAWFAGEDWKLRAFRDYDTIIPGEFDKKGRPRRAGPDLYILAASGILNKLLEEITDFERQGVGKVSELALGFQGSVNAFISMGDNYGVTPYDISGPVMETSSSQLWDETAAKYETAMDKEGLFEKEWTAIKIVVNNWRKRNPAIVQSWWDYQDAAIAATINRHTVVPVVNGKVNYYCDDTNLWCVLPGGRMLCYAEPEVRTSKVERTRKDGTKYEATKHTVMFYTGNDKGQWVQEALYGGLQCENIVQAAARDIMVDRMLDAEAQGFPHVLTVHDEILTEVDTSSAWHNKKTLEQIMSVVPKEYEGLPLAAATWEDTRYVK